MRLMFLAVMITVLMLAVPAQALSSVKIGMITTLSTPAGYLGEETRDGFQLAIDQEHGRLGGIAVQLLVEDDATDPQKAKQIADRFIKHDGVKIMTGIVFSNVAIAVVPDVVNQDVVYLSTNAGPSLLAGEMCHPNYFNVAYQNDNLDEVVGKYVTNAGFKRLYLLAPNYQAGKDHLEGFKRYYQGAVVAEIYTKLGQLDYKEEIAFLQTAKPDAVYFFLPGGMGINFLKQYAQAGLIQSIPVFGPAFSFDERLLQSVKDAAVGAKNGSQWCHDLNYPANRQFVAAFKKTYGRVPTLYASQGYDTARLIGSALKECNGELADLHVLRRTIRKANFESVRGQFSFSANQHPIQNIYTREVVKTPDGQYINKTIKRVFTNRSNIYVPQCKMN